MSKRKEITFEELRAKYAHLSDGLFYQQLEVEQWMDKHAVLGNRDDLTALLKGNGKFSKPKAA